MSDQNARERVQNQEWIAAHLAAVDCAEWDRFTVGDWGGDQSVSVYGWIDREDAYKDFVLVIFWPESETLYYTTSSDEYTNQIHQTLFDEEPDKHNDCRRVEHTFDVENCVQLHEDASLGDFDKFVTDGGRRNPDATATTKYDVPDDHWESDPPDGPPAWKNDTAAKSIEIDVRLYEEGYQNDEKWTVHCTERLDHADVIAAYAITHQNKGNYWRPGERWRDAVDFADLPLRVRQRVAAVLNRDLDAITPDHRTIHREDGTGIADPDDERDPADDDISERLSEVIDDA